ncbi:hypothetical protein KYC5002_33465 [Archangium violaceum]|uniref:hypothetical protein n=1 Tax=Archangium violaceum TaxID=83451 RepID=UPI002B2D5337|nr:hypothetical protein KYC5002_33465 [Archangium gephyra]
MPVRSPYRDALRLLYIFVNGAEPLPHPDSSGATVIFRGEAKLHAYDFWMRNPDYLAEELLDLFVKSGEKQYLVEAEGIFAAEEPDIRRFPMIRYRFGAYERLDDTLALLKSRDLIRITGTKAGVKVMETDFLVMPIAIQSAQAIEKDFPVLKWYARRALLVAEIAAGRGGAALKKRQYEQADYAETQMGGVIPPITARVRARLAALKQNM